ncbi:alpha/beta fold hydrolase [Catenovulum sp. SM1970]|uniref:alpha/beta fold hydrolase n=1 Tax=Marinifaba aquimaris TaxID=2741323 RepID=UPI001572B74E|nr:alpha/beta fold hydrolase [Marinifaba aquimaris]NTS78569.1 alpha/beta fold hydrolase [Marinifaba aquimaris]
MDNREHNWSDFFTNTIEPFWHQYAHQWVYQPTPELNVHYALIEHPSRQKLIILISGRCETFLKNKELIFDLHQAGYSVLTVDHRGQGLSDRELKDTEKGYISQFDCYADDLHAIIKETRCLANYADVAILAHSMGSAVALDYLYRYQPDINAIAMTAPLLGVNAGPLNQSQALLLSESVLWFDTLAKKEAGYFIGQTPYNPTAFADSQLTHCEPRHQYCQRVFAQDEIRLGGVTTHWLNQTLKKIKQLNENVSRLNSPTLLLQASEESVVSNKAQLTWLENAKKADKDIQFIEVVGAKHEILQESDNIRSQALTQILDFFEAHSC